MLTRSGVVVACCGHAALAAIDPSLRKRNTVTTSLRSSSSVQAEFSELTARARGRACMVGAACMGAARMGTAVVVPSSGRRVNAVLLCLPL